MHDGDSIDIVIIIIIVTFAYIRNMYVVLCKTHAPTQPTAQSAGKTFVATFAIIVIIIIIIIIIIVVVVIVVVVFVVVVVVIDQLLMSTQGLCSVHQKNNVYCIVCTLCVHQGGITCGAIDEPRKSSKAIDEPFSSIDSFSVLLIDFLFYR